MQKFIRKASKLLAGLLILACFLVVTGYLALKTSVSDYDGSLNLSEITDNIEIVRDENAIPHIYASSLADAYFGLGFAHAQDRLWQLELTRAASNGQLSEIFGEGSLATDKLTRTVGSSQIAKLSLERMDAETKELLQRYVDGVNSYIENRTGLLPPEFILFSAEPKPWKLTDTTAIFALIALGADNWHQELLRAEMQRTLSDDQISDLYPSYPEEGLVTHGPQRRTNASDTNSPALVEMVKTTQQLPFISQLAKLSSHPLFAAFPASNTWVVHGSRTKSGKPILASDPHGPIKAPADYYLAHLSGPDFDVTGVGYPGLPVFAIGHNRHIAWGLTDIVADMTDLFAEHSVPERPTHYITAEGEKPFITRQETIKVKGQDDVTLTLRSTHNGPVISDIVDTAESIAEQTAQGSVLSIVNATISEGNLSAQAFMRINRAQNWEQFRAAMRDYEMAQNLSYADAEGNIGMISSARVPIRKSGDGFMITNTSDPNTGIEGYAGPNQMPYSFNPEEGFLVNANNKVSASNSGPFFSREDVMPFRADRIVEKIRSTQDHTVSSMAQIQVDVVSNAAKQLLPIMLAIEPPTEKATQIVKRLSSWRGLMDRALVEPTLYMSWEREINRLLYQDELGPSFNQFFASRPYLVNELINRKGHWCNDIRTETTESCPDIVSQALMNSIDQLSKKFGPDMEQWTWGKAHRAVFAHDIFSHVPILKIFSDIELPNSGGPHTVNQAKSSYVADRPFDQNYGPRYRQVIDLSDFTKSRFMIAPGVSGNYLSPYYSHLAKRWRDQEYIQIKQQKAEVEQTAIGTTHLIKTKH